MPRSFADYAIAFNRKLSKLPLPFLPEAYRMMNPFCEGLALPISTDFYRKYYSDHKKRRMIFGINPGRHGAGLTGVPFTDTRYLKQSLNIEPRNLRSYELSAVFMYKLIERYGGPKKFYQDFYINSPLPLGLLRVKPDGKAVNANYYESPDLSQSVQGMIKMSMQAYIKIPLLDRTVAFCLGQGQNYSYLEKLNKLSEAQYFCKLVALAHPRYIMQYRRKYIEEHIADMLKVLTS